MARLEPRERARDQEAGRAEDVGTPDVMPCLGRADGRPDGDERADVELDGANELHAGGQPVDLTRQEHEDLTAEVAWPPRRGLDRLAVLQEAGRCEEQRPDEERHRVGPGAHGVRVPRHRAQAEKERARREQHADPPVAILRCPPDRAARRRRGQVLAARTGFPRVHHGRIRSPAAGSHPPARMSSRLVYRRRVTVRSKEWPHLVAR
jgi:hypothetical protein